MADPSGYLPTPDFASEMDRVYGPGNWRQTGGWRSQERENQLRAQGAQTVAPGRLSDHSRGASDAPGARDVVWLGHTPQQAAERLRAAQAAGQIAGVGQLYPEGAAGGQGAHLHVGLQPGVQADPWNHVLRVGDAPQPGAGPAPAAAADPWGTVLKVGGAAPAADPWGTVLKPAAPPDDFWHQAGRAIASAVGGAAGGVGSVIAGVEDAAEAFRRDDVLADAAKVRSGEAARSGWSKAEQDQALADADTLRRTGGIDFHPRATATARGVAAAATAADASISPANRTPLESTLHGAFQFAPVLAAGAVSPITGALTFGAQGYESTYQAALAKGADEATARRAAALSGGIQYGLGALPVSAASDALVEATGGAGLGAIVPRVLGSGVANAGLMAANQTAENVAAQQTYDPDRPTGAGVAEAAEQGALVGGGMHAVGAGLGLARGAVSRLRRTDAPSPPPAAPTDDTTTSPSGPGAPPSGPSPPAAPAPGLDGLPEPLAASTYYAHTSQPPEPIPEVPTATVETGPPAGLPPEPLASAAAPVPKAPPPPPPASYEDARVAYGAPADLMPGAIADVEDLRGAAPRQHSLFAAIRAIGGIRTVARDGSRESDVQQILQGAKLQPGTVNNKTGLSPDAMRGALQERGWFGVYDPAAQAGSNPGDNINDLYEAMRRESAGQRVFHPEDITPQSLAYRAAMEQEQADAGIVASDSKAVAAAKLAAHRAEVNRALGPDTTELKARAAALGIEPAAGASYEELLGDVLEREAIQGEVPNGQHWAAAQRQVLDELSPEDHAWLSDAERGPRGEQDVAGAARASGRGAASQSRTPHEDTPFAEGATSDRLGPSPVPAGAELAHIDPRALADVYEAGWFPFGHRLAEAEGAIRAGQYLTVPVAEYDREVRGAPFAAHLVANTRFEGKPEPLRMQDGRLVGTPTETTRLGGQTVEQGLFPGAEASARQAAAAREGALRASTPQQGAGPLFEAPDTTGELKFQREAADASARTPAFRRWFGKSKVVDAEGKPQVVYHGANRGDRIDDEGRFRADRARSGPMPYFTESSEIASNYAKSKADTSDEFDDDADRWTVGGAKLPEAWLKLTPAERGNIRLNGWRIGEDEESGRIGRDGEHAYGKETWEQYLREARGNGLRALYDLWINAGTLFGEEHRFKDVLRAFGLSGIGYEDPRAEHPSVFPVHLAIEKPLDAHAIPAKVLTALRAAARKAPKPQYERGVDQWDKRAMAPADWMRLVNEGLKDPTYSFGFTVMPDWATDVLRKFGYDGVKDTGGKMGGDQHTVWVPFHETQVKSIFNRGTYDPNDPRISFQRAYHGSPHDFDRFSSDRIGTGEGAQAFGHGLYFAGHEAVAQGYRDRLANAHMEVRTRERSLRDDHGAPGIIGRDALRDFRGKLPEDVAQAGGKAAYEIDKVIGDALHLMRNARLRRVRDGSEALHGAVDALRATEPPYGFSPALREMTLDWLSQSGMDLIQHKAGKLYHVEIPEDHEFLDRDKPLREQSPAVRKAIERLDREMGLHLGPTTKGGVIYELLAAKLAQDKPRLDEGDGWRVATPERYSDPEGASRLLREAGIPGLRYLDQFSRDSGQGSHNYVVFDDSRIETVAKFQRQRVFYSALERAVDRSPQATAPADQWKRTLSNTPGVKKEELEWTGIHDWLDLFGSEKVPKEAVAAFLRENGVKVEETLNGGHASGEDEAAIERRAEEIYEQEIAATVDRLRETASWHHRSDEEIEEYARDSGVGYENALERAREELAPPGTEYEDWQLPGGQNYRELLLTLPKVADPPATHWDTPGVMAHVRFNERTAPDGKKVLFIEEIQSDWHQKGRDQGYAQTASRETIKAAEQRLADAENRLDEAGPRFTAAARPVLERALPALDQAAAEADAEAQAATAEYQAALRQADRYAPGRSHGVMGRAVHAAEVRQRDLQRLAEDVRVAIDLIDRRGVVRPRQVEDAVHRALLGVATDGHDVGGAAEIATEYNHARLAFSEADQALDRARQPKGIPNAPFKTTWPALVMKRMISWAAEHGFDRIAWTTGAQQADRYSLGHHLDTLELSDNSSGGIGHADLNGEFEHGVVRGFQGGRQVLEQHVRGRDGLDELIGRELADRLLASQARRGTRAGFGVRLREVADLNEHVGGSGMKAFYDRNLVNITNDLIKKHGGRVEKVRVNNLGDGSAGARPEDIQRLHEARNREMDAEHEMHRLERESVGPPTEERLAIRAQAAAARIAHREALREYDAAKEAVSAGEQHGFDLTDQLRDAATDGFPLFHRAAERLPTDPHEGMEPIHTRLTGEPADPNGPHADIIREVADVIRRLAPQAEVRPMARIADRYAPADRVSGAQWREGMKQVIAWSLESADHIQTGRHEAVHAIWHLLTQAERKALEGTVIAQGWIQRYRIDRNYADVSHAKQLEEAVAHRFAEWRADGKAGGVLPSIVRVIFQRMADALKQVGDAVRRAFGGDVTAEEVFRRIESGEIGRRTGALQERRGAAFQRERDDKTLDELKSPPAVLDRLIGEGPDKLGRAIANGLGRIFSDDAKDIARNIHMGLNPMATGDVKAQDTIKAYLSTLRAIDWEHAKADKWLESRFPKDARDRMGLALDQHGVLVRRGVEPGEHGLDALTQAQRAAVEEFNRRQEVVFRLAGEEGIHDTEGLAFHFPRMGVRKGGGRIRNDTPRRRGVEGGKLSTTTGQMRQRKYETMAETEAALKRAYGDDTYISRDIRALNLGTRNLMRAWAGKRLVNTIKAIGKESMAELVSADPALKGDPEWFHIDHPAMTERKVKREKDPERPGKMKALLDEHGEPIFEPRPLYMPKSWEGPMKVALAKPDPVAWRAFMTLKSKAVGAIMYNPLVHNQVIFGKAFPTMVRHAGGDLKNPLTWPGGVLNVLTFKMYRDGYLVKTDDVLMNRALTVGNVVPITGHYVMMDLGAIEGERSLESGHGWTSQIVGAAAKMMNHAWEEPTKQAIDKFHDFVSNRMLWDQVANLQMGIWKATTDHYQHMGYPQDVADKLAGDAANLYAGAVPREALSGLARGILNGVLFSRSFHQTNLGGVKRAIMGLPSDVRAQITVAHGPEMAAKASGAMRAQMASTIMIDLAAAYAFRALAAGAVAVLLGRAIQWPQDNEEGKKDKVLVGYEPDGTAIYMNLPFGKYAGELTEWQSEPLTYANRIMFGPTRLALAYLGPDGGNLGYGRQAYTPHDARLSVQANNWFKAAGLVTQSVFPVGTLSAIVNSSSAPTETDRKYAQAQLIGQMSGFTISHGAPGGPAVGDLLRVSERLRGEQAEQMPDIRRQIKTGDTAGAMRRMIALGMAPGLARWEVKVTLNPKARIGEAALQRLTRGGTPEEQAQYGRDHASAP